MVVMVQIPFLDPLHLLAAAAVQDITQELAQGVEVEAAGLNLVQEDQERLAKVSQVGTQLRHHQQDQTTRRPAVAERVRLAKVRFLHQ
jgi:capsular polysaccharide biosynthesis protein